MAGPDFCGDKDLVAPDTGGAQALADLALVLVDLRGVDVAIAQPQRLLDDPSAGAAAQSHVPSPIAESGAIGLDEMHAAIMGRGACAANSHRRRFRGECREYGVRGMRDHGEKRPRRSARRPLALQSPIPIVHGHAEPGGKFGLCQTGAAPQVTDRREHRWFCRISRRQRRLQRKFLPVVQFDDPSIRFQPQPPHVPLQDQRL